VTSTLARPTAVPAGRPDRRSLALAGLRAAGWAAAAGLLAVGLPVLVVWGTDARGTAGIGAALRAAGQVFVVANGGSLDLPQGRLGLVPLGLVALPGVLLGCAGRQAARRTGARSLRAATTVAAMVAMPYAGLVAGVLMTVMATGPAGSAATSAAATVGRALLAAAVVAGLGAGVGAVAGGTGVAGLRTALGSALTPATRTLAASSAGALAVLLAAGALLVGAALAASGQEAASVAVATSPGPVGGVGLLLLGLALVPNAVVWGASWLAGPGFAVGTGTSVGPFGYELGPVPALPLFAALPSGAPPRALAVGVLVVPLVAGAFAGWLTHQRSGRWPPSRATAAAALTGPVVGFAMAVLAALSGGPAGGVRLAAVGPSPWRVGLAVTIAVAVGAAATAAGLRRAAGAPDD